MKKMVTFCISLIFIFSLSFPQTSYASDIDGHWAKDDIQELVNRNIMGGYGDGVYLPNNNITRAEFTQLVLKSLNITARNYDSSFQDVKKGDWFHDSVVTAKELGLVNGTSSNTFSPKKAITRQDISVIITTALSMKNINSIESRNLFLDEHTISSYAKPSVKRLQHLGIVSGKIKGPNNKYYFKPKDNATRAEAAVMLVRMLRAIEQPNEIIRTVTYDYDFKQMADKQMASSSRPQTDYGWVWYDASRTMVEHYANPNNFRYHETNIYQFLVLSGSSGISAQKLNTQVLNGKGHLHGTADFFVRASQLHNVNDVYLIAHSLLETGHGTSKLATGIEVGLNKENKPTMVTAQNRSQLTNIKKTYNMFGIGAYDHCPEQCGSERAYTLGWFSVEEAILGGAKFISNDYIGVGQDTIFKMRWNPNAPATHQYATDVGWALKQTTRIKEMFEIVNGMGGHPLVFEVPQFKNQPKSSTLPTGVAMFNVDKKLEGEIAFVKGDQFLRSGPHANFNTLGNQVKNGDEVTIIGQNKNWYKVKIGSTNGWILASNLELAKDKNGAVNKASLEEILLEDNASFDSSQEDTLDSNAHDISFATVKSDGVPLYSEPSIENDVITELNLGTEMIIIDENEDWVKVYVNDGTSVVTGWIYKQYIVMNLDN